MLMKMNFLIDIVQWFELLFRKPLIVSLRFSKKLFTEYPRIVASVCFLFYNKHLLQRVTSHFLQQVTSATSNKQNVQRETSDSTRSIEQIVNFNEQQTMSKKLHLLKQRTNYWNKMSFLDKHSITEYKT